MTTTNSELANQARGIARNLTYNEDTPQAEAKHTLLEMAHRLDTLDVRVYKATDKTLRAKNGIGKERVLTRTERVAWLLFGAKPERV